jgi:predicted lipoprotein with Yx(FWY)xxD motif
MRPSIKEAMLPNKSGLSRVCRKVCDRRTLLNGPTGREYHMKHASARGALLLAATLAIPLAASAATTLTAQNGMTVYTFDKDAGGASACYDDCAKNWPPYLAKVDQKMGEGWATVKRKDGSMQWTYDGKPLYYFRADQKKGDATGDGKGGVWHKISE